MRLVGSTTHRMNEAPPLPPNNGFILRALSLSFSGERSAGPSSTRSPPVSPTNPASPKERGAATTDDLSVVHEEASVNNTPHNHTSSPLSFRGLQDFDNTLRIRTTFSPTPFSRSTTPAEGEHHHQAVSLSPVSSPISNSIRVLSSRIASPITNIIAKSPLMKSARERFEQAQRWTHQMGMKAYDAIPGSLRPLDDVFLERLYSDILIKVWRRVEDQHKLRDRAAITVTDALRIKIAKRRAKEAEREAEEIAHALAIERNEVYNNKIRARIRMKQVSKEARDLLSSSLMREVLAKGTLSVMIRKIQKVWRGVLGRRLAEEIRRNRRVKPPTPVPEVLEPPPSPPVPPKPKRRRPRPPAKPMSAAERRVWARKLWIHSGWKPSWDGGDYDPFDYIWQAPKGSKHGLRIHKVKIPCHDDDDGDRILNDKNTWIGIPIGIKEMPDPPPRLGCRPRYDTPHCSTQAPKDWTIASTIRKQFPKDRYMMKYNWFPAKLISSKHLSLLIASLNTPSPRVFVSG